MTSKRSLVSLVSLFSNLLRPAHRDRPDVIARAGLQSPRRAAIARPTPTAARPSRVVPVMRGWRAALV